MNMRLLVAQVVALCGFFGVQAMHMTEGQKKLLGALEAGNTKLVQEIVDSRVDCNFRDKIGFTPLHHAVVSKNEGLLVALLSSRTINVDMSDRYGDDPMQWSPLCWASDEKIIALLVNLKKADANFCDKRLQTPLFQIVIYGEPARKVALAKALLERGALVDKIDYKGRTALHWAAQEGDVELVKLLVLYGAPVDTKDLEQQTAAEVAAACDHKNIAEYLKKQSSITPVQQIGNDRNIVPKIVKMMLANARKKNGSRRTMHASGLNGTHFKYRAVI